MLTNWKRQLFPILLIGVIVIGTLTLSNIGIFSFSPFYGKKVNQDIGPFSLVDSNGKEFTESYFFGKYSFLFFGFTKCNGTCPKNMGVFSKLSQSKLLSDASFIFISIDPRDSIDRVRSYVNTFSKRFIGVTSGKSNTLEIAERLHAYTFIDQVELKSNPSYQINHAGFIYLIDPKAKLQLIYPYKEIDVIKVTNDYRRLLSEGTRNL